MNKLKLGEWVDRPYGRRGAGTIHVDGVHGSEDRCIPVTVREPHGNVLGSGHTYILGYGLTAGPNFMRKTALEALRLGHTVLVFGYTNTKLTDALARNSEDMAAAINASPEGARSVIAHSMAGACLPRALARADTKVERATFVAPGGFMSPDYYSMPKLARRICDEALELAEPQLRRHPRTAWELGRAVAANFVRRPGAVGAEAYELTHHSAHTDLCAVKAAPNAPYLRFAYGLEDRFLPAAAQLASIAGLPFDSVHGYRGGHNRLVYDETLAEGILAMDARLAAGLPEAASLLLAA